MRTHELWHDIEKRSPRAALINHEFIQALVVEPSKCIIPQFDAATGRAIGIEATTPGNSTPLAVEIGDWLIQHPNGDIERVDGHTFGYAYTLRD